VFFIKSKEKTAICPNCGGELKYHSTVTRPLNEITEEKKTYGIRVLKCTNKACPKKYHRELPDIMIPYKRYDAASIEEAITNRNRYKVTIRADESTIWRWRNWFKTNAWQMIMALLSVLIAINGNAETSSLETQKQTVCSPIEKLQAILGRRAKWLSETARILVNFSKWVFNRSAFLPGHW